MTYMILLSLCGLNLGKPLRGTLTTNGMRYRIILWMIKKGRPFCYNSIDRRKWCLKVKMISFIAAVKEDQHLALGIFILLMAATRTKNHMQIFHKSTIEMRKNIERIKIAFIISVEQKREKTLRLSAKCPKQSYSGRYRFNFWRSWWWLSLKAIQTS